MLTPLHKFTAASSTALLLTLGACTPQATPPDVLLISIDSMRADTLTFLDPATTPNLARLARRGTVFRQALSGSSWTLPAHAQMFTGMPPSVHGVQQDDTRIDPATRTLPESLADGGWHTTGFWTGWYLSSEYGFGRGFDTYENSMTVDPLANAALKQALEARGDTDEEQLSLMRQVASHQDITSERLAADVLASLDELDQQDSATPRFLFCHLFDPHYDYIPPAPFDTQFDPDYAGSMTGLDFWDNPAVFDKDKSPARQISDRDLEHVRALYRGELAWTDAALGRILDRLEQDGRLANTLVIVTSDHGEEFFEHGNRGHRNSLFDEVLRVPLLIVPPGSDADASSAQLCDTQVTLSDLMPTILDFAQLASPDEVHGRSLRPLLEGRDLPERPAVSSLMVRFKPEGRDEYGYALTQALRTPSEKFVRLLTFDGPRMTVRAFAHYDLGADPAEQRPSTTSDRAQIAAAWEAFENGLEPARSAFAARARAPLAERITRVRESFVGELEGLGYMDGEVEEALTLPAWRLQPPRRLPLPQRL